MTLANALKAESPLSIVGVPYTLAALLAQAAGFKALYLSGSGLANAHYGIPDLGLTTLTELCAEVSRITSASHLPLLVDGDTGFGEGLSVARSIKQLAKAGAAAVHIEDQPFTKRCGHLAGKAVVPLATMVARVKAAVDARPHSDFWIMARTDALALEPKDAVLERIMRYVEAGADAIFLEAVTSPAEYAFFTQQVKAPILANLTEFGKTPLLTREESKALGIQMLLYPLGAFRMMNKAVEHFYKTLAAQGTQASLVPEMFTRKALYELTNYEDWEKKQEEYLGL